MIIAWRRRGTGGAGRGNFPCCRKRRSCVLRLNRSLADLVGRGAGGASINGRHRRRKPTSLEQLASKGFAGADSTAHRINRRCSPDISIVIPVKDRAGRAGALPDVPLQSRLPPGKTSSDRGGRRQQRRLSAGGATVRGSAGAIRAVPGGGLLLPATSAPHGQRRDSCLHRFRLHRFAGVAARTDPRF